MIGCHNHRRRAWWFATVCLIMTCCSQGNSPEKLHHWGQFLPDAPAGWRETNDTRFFSGVDLSNYINGGAEAYFAYGFREVAIREFGDSGGARLTIEIYKMDRPENAYGIFSIDPAGERWPIGADASYGSGLLRFWKGPYFVRVLCFPAGPSVEAVIRETGEKIAAAVTDENRRPEILSILPDTDIDPDSVCYFHRQTSLNNIHFISDENLLHLGDEIEAITWEQKTSSPPTNDLRLRLLSLLYPSDSAAAKAFDSFTGKYMRTEGGQAPGTQAAPLTARISENKYAAAMCPGRWLLIALDAESAEAATRAVRSIQTRLDVLTTNNKGGSP